MSPETLDRPSAPDLRSRTDSQADSPPHAIVVGAGFGGLAAALRLRARGYSVDLIDRQQAPGGRAQVYERGGFVHDAGPTVITAPFLFEELFELFGERLSDHVELVPVEPWYRFEFNDGNRFDYGGTVEDTLQEIRRFDPRDAAGYQRLLESSRKIFDKGFTDLADRPFLRFTDMLKVVPDLVRLGSHRTVSGLVSKHLKDERLRQAFSIQPLLVGGNPFDTTSIYALIHYLERQWGVWFAMGGTGALVRGLLGLAERHGIRFLGGRTVKRLSVHSGRVRGVQLEGGVEMRADLVVSDGDPPWLYRNAIASKDRKRWTNGKIDRLSYSMGLFVLYFGTRRKYEDVAHHTIVMGPRFKGLLDDIFHRKHLAEDFSLYLHRPTATDPSMAPEGCDSFYVLSPVPNLQAGIDWEKEGPRYRDRIVKELSKRVLPGLEESICEDFFVTPEHFQQSYLSQHGTGFSIAPLFQQSAWFRFHNRSEDVEGLYLVGAGTHPGAGLPGVLSSAKALDRIVPNPVRRR